MKKDFITEHTNIPIALLDKINNLENENKKLKNENKKLKNENSTLNFKLKKTQKKPSFRKKYKKS
jgi:uncharacterized protein (UPF0335 family)